MTSLVLSAFLIIGAAHADQQRWAAAYVDWSFPENTAPGAALEQDLWIPQAAVASYFTVNWDFVGGGNGYMGLQSDQTGAGNVRFSLWNAAQARGQACRPFGGEGVGMTCELPLTIAPNRLYRLRLVRARADAAGRWWVGRLVWRETNGTLRELTIGEIRVAAGDRLLDPATIGNFSEYWGDRVARCQDVPLSAAIFAPPVLIGAQPGARRTAAPAPAARTPEGNICTRGNEREGAVAAHIPLALGGRMGMIVTLGGARAENTALSVRIRAQQPPRPPTP